MRLIIPDEISEMNKKIVPYLKLIEGKGMVLVDDAPDEIKQMKIKVDKWFESHKE